MNELVKIITNNGFKAVSARELYEKLGYDISQWSRWYKKNITENEFAIPSEDYVQLDMMSRTTDFALKLDFAKKIAMMARTETGEKIRDYFIEVEKRQNQKPLPQTYVSALRELANEVELRELAEGKIKELQPKAESYDRFLDSNKYMTIADVAKTLHYDKAGPNQLFDILRKHGILSNQKGKNWNLPHQQYIDQKLFVVKKTEKEINGDVQYFSTPYVTAKGLERINIYLRKLGFKQIES